jgi:uncharacterized protein
MMLRIIIATISLFLFALPVTNRGVVTIRHEEVRIKSGEVELAATISIPRMGNGPFPAIVSVHGSGPVRRQDLNLYWRHLAPQGMVVLTYDKRGVADSSGTFTEVGSASGEAQLRTLAADARACLEFLKQHKSVDPQRMGFFGGSQAGWIIPLASDGRTDVAFNIILSGPATSIGLEMYYSYLTGEGRQAGQGLNPEEIERRLDVYEGPAGYEPMPVLARLQTPTLWLLGEKDISIPILRTTKALQRLKDQGSPLTIKIYPNANHGLNDATTGQALPYWNDTLAWLQQTRVLR